MPKRQRGGYPGSPRSDSSGSSSGSSRHSSNQGRQAAAGAGASSSNSDEVVQRLCNIFSDMRVEVARYLLEACNWDLEKAVQLHLESPTEIPPSVSQAADIPEHANRFDSLVINDDSDDDSEIPPVRPRRMSPVRSQANPPAKPLNSDQVRAPIAPQQMRLVDDMEHGIGRSLPGTFRPLQFARALGTSGTSGGTSSSSNNTNSSGNGNAASNFRDAVARAYQGRDDLPGPSGSTFDRYRFMASDTLPPEKDQPKEKPTSSAPGSSSSTEASRSRSHQQPPLALPNGIPATVSDDGSTTTLDRIFKPPIDLMFRGTFQEARRYATSTNRWLIVNVQELNEFPSLCMNRDIWRDKRFVELIQNSLVLWQVYNDGHEGVRFIQFYKVNAYPFVGIIDPRTGERVAVLPTSPNELFQKLNDFLAEKPSPELSPANSPMKKPKVGVAQEEAHLKKPLSSALASSEKPTTNGHATPATGKTALVTSIPTNNSSKSAPLPTEKASNGALSRKIEPSSTPKQIDVSVCPSGSTPFFHVLVHLPNDDRLLVKLHESATLQELIAAISSNFASFTVTEFTLIRNAATPGGAKLDLLTLAPQAQSVSLRDTLKFCKREKIFLDLKQ